VVLSLGLPLNLDMQFLPLLSPP